MGSRAGPKAQRERTKESLRELAELHPEDPSCANLPNGAVAVGGGTYGAPEWRQKTEVRSQKSE